MLRTRFRIWSGLWLVGWLVLAPVQADTLADAVKAIREVGPGGRGNVEASAAVDELTKTATPADLPALLAGFDGANPLALNWLRAAAEAIADKGSQAGQKLPRPELEAFIKETQHNPLARRLAYEMLLPGDPQLADRLIPGMLQDPSIEFRRDAVERLITAATKLNEAGKEDQARSTFETALQGARDGDQVEAIVKPLEKLGVKVDLPKHFGFLQDWQLIGPFDNAGNKGFNTAYPPESEIKLDAKYAGQNGDVAWSSHATTEKYGIMDLAEELAPHKGAVTYAYHVFDAPADQTIEIRLGTPNAWKLWVNGEFLFGRDEYHRGMTVDQYRVPVKLKQGKNEILLKVCQNEQKEEWAQRWQYQVRVCDATGTAILSTVRPEIPEPKPAEEAAGDTK